MVSAISSGGNAGRLRLALLGDCMFGRLVNEVLQNAPPAYPWGDTLPLLLGADFRICNLECVISDRGSPWHAYTKSFHFRSAARNIAVLKTARIDIVSLANNHILDYGSDALAEMLDLLDRVGIGHAGAGLDLEQASRPAAAEVCGKKLGLLAFTDNEPAWEATDGRAGTFYVPTDLHDPRAQRLLEMVRRQKDLFDLLIVSGHWGSNWGYRPPQEHVSFAHALVDAGAWLVFGHSSHVFRGIGFHKARPILYGAGNFVDDYAVDRIERNDEAFVYVLRIGNGAPACLELYPTTIRRCRARRAAGVHARSIVEKMRDLCAGLGSWTETEWDSAGGCLEVRASAMSPAAPRRNTH